MDKNQKDMKGKVNTAFQSKDEKNISSNKTADQKSVDKKEEDKKSTSTHKK